MCCLLIYTNKHCTLLMCFTASHGVLTAPMVGGRTLSVGVFFDFTMVGSIPVPVA